MPFSYVSYAADFTCNISPAIGFSSGSLDCTEEKEIDYKTAGKGLRILLDWLNENSTTNTNSNNNSGDSIPRNAYSYKNTWKCYDGYKKSGNRCTKQSYKIPQNAYRTKGTWKCLTSFVKSGNTCIKASVNSDAPSNSYVLSSGEWKCNNGFKKSGNSCIKASVNSDAPSNSYVLSSGEWKCNNGFKKSGNSCIKEQNKPLEDSGDYLEKIKQAKVLFDSGVITEDEFAEIKKRIIDNI
jgi:hypothetical protein